MDTSIEEKIQKVVDIFNFRLQNPIKSEPLFSTTLDLLVGYHTITITPELAFSMKRGSAEPPEIHFDRGVVSLSLEELEKLLEGKEALTVTFQTGKMTVINYNDEIKQLSILI